jgi:ribosomal protein L29
MTDQEYIESLLEQNGKLIYENKQLRRANSRLKNEIRNLRRNIAKIKDEQQNNKQHYRNGQKRGKTRNG